MIIVSVFVSMQVVGLAVMVWYVNSVPTWAPGLDAMAIARIGRAIRDGELPPIGPVSDGDRDKLRNVDALVGIVDDGERERSVSWEQAEVTEDQPGTDRSLVGSDSTGVAGDQPGPGHPLVNKDSAGVGENGGLVFGLDAKGLITRDAVAKKQSWFGKRRKKASDGVV